MLRYGVQAIFIMPPLSTKPYRLELAASKKKLLEKLNVTLVEKNAAAHHSLVGPIAENSMLGEQKVAAQSYGVPVCRLHIMAHYLRINVLMSYL